MLKVNRGQASRIAGTVWSMAALSVAAPAALALVFETPASAQYTAPSPWETSLRELRRAATYANDGSHHPLLVALRQLRDPSLKRLFQSLVQGSHWTIQIDGILGLAELDPNGMVDPFLLGQLKGENDRSTAISAAIGMEMVGVEQAQAMLAWDDLPPRDRILLMAELFRRGGTPDREKLVALTTHRNDEVAGLASLLHATITNEKSALDAFKTRCGALKARERDAALVALAGASLRFKLVGATTFLAGALDDAGLSNEARLASIGALLHLDPTVGYAAWKQALTSDPGHANRVRLALIALAADTTLPANAAEPLRSMPAGEPLEPLIEKLADAIDALHGSGDATKAFPALVALKHRPSAAAALEAAKRLRSDAQRATYEAFADLVTSAKRSETPAPVAELAIDAIGRLGILDPALVASRIANAGADGSDAARLVDLLILALMQSNTKEAASVAMAARPKASRRGAAIALLLNARFVDTLSPAELDELGVTAAGGWSLDPGLQIQAAWLYAKLAGRADEAIAAVLQTSTGDAPPTTPAAPTGESKAKGDADTTSSEGSDGASSKPASQRTEPVMSPKGTAS